MRNQRHNILFEPIQLGPVTAKNRFYQVPHCSGMGWRRPKTAAAMRGVKAEGGWGVVNTEYCSIHPSSDNDSFPYAALWDNNDIKAHSLMTSKVHEHGALAGVELWIGGGMIVNLGTRIPALGVQNRPQTDYSVNHPGQGRALDKQDIKNIRSWHKDAAIRAVTAGFDIVYVYATHGYLLSEFLNSSTNDRSDEYGGCLENRIRLVKELIEETKEAVAGKAAVATRFSVDLEEPESYDAFGLLADLPDLWDLTVNDYNTEMGNSRFVKEGSLVSSVSAAKLLTKKPVVAVGRFTSPDKMAELIKNGSQDLIGAARPSIADPFLPIKISEGRIEDIRECIGCNICYAHDSLGVPIRCTQNPTMGEEWRFGWHPEKIKKKQSPKRFLVVGAGPSGLEAARVLGEQGNEVILAEATRNLGGRVIKESNLLGLAEWRRVSDWRITQINKLSNVEIYRESELVAKDVTELNADFVMIATGAKWSEDALGRHSDTGFETVDTNMIIGAEHVLNGEKIDGDRIVIYDDDHYYIGSVMALELSRRGHSVVLVTPAGRACSWGEYTDEQVPSNLALYDANVKVITNKTIINVARGVAEAKCIYSSESISIKCDGVIPLTRRIPSVQLYNSLIKMVDNSKKHSIIKIGDADAPSHIAGAVYSGYRNAIECGANFSSSEFYGKRENELI